MITAQPRAISVSAAADFLGTGAIEVPVFEKEIYDILRRSSYALQRIKPLPATGHPHRYFDQTAIATGAAVDPRNLTSTPSGPNRVERPAFIKATIAQSNISLFDKDVTEQQGQFASVVAKDVEDIISGIEVFRGQSLWQGTDTSLVAPTTLQWCGGLEQIASQVTIAIGASIIDGLKTIVANQVSNATYVVRPSAFYVNPLLANLIDQEAKATRITLDSVEVVAGVTVAAISTQVGKLPIIGDVYMPYDATTGTSSYGFTAAATGYRNYYGACVTENDIEIPVISGKEYNPNPRLFQLGLVGNLAGQFVGIKFDAVIFKGASYTSPNYGPHVAFAVVRP